jgi:hypothetical protein
MYIRIIAPIALCVLLSACGGSSSSGNNPTVTPQGLIQDGSGVYTLNIASSNMDCTIDDVPVSSELQPARTINDVVVSETANGDITAAAENDVVYTGGREENNGFTIVTVNGTVVTSLSGEFSVSGWNGVFSATSDNNAGGSSIRCTILSTFSGARQ